MDPNNSQGGQSDLLIALQNIALAISLRRVRTTDANGWSVVDCGEYIRYTKRVTFSQSVGSLGTGVNLTTSSSNFPVGVSSLGSSQFSYSYAIAADSGLFNIVAFMTSSSSSLAFVVRNAHTSSLTCTGFLDVEITVFP